MNAPILEIDRLEMRFGGLRALSEVSFTAKRGEITSVIGPNGAGKTTLFNCMTGMYRATGGRVLLGGEDLTRLPPHAIARRGVARTFQNLALFEGLTIVDNLKVGAYDRGRSGLIAGGLLSGRARREEQEAYALAHDTLAFLGASDLADKRPAELSYGQQKRVEVARALMQDARLLLLDEPMAGMNESEKRALSDLILRARAERGLSILLVEHDMPVVMGVSDHVVVLDFGVKIAEGAPAAVSADPKVIAAYLGSDETDALA